MGERGLRHSHSILSGSRKARLALSTTCTIVLVFALVGLRGMTTLAQTDDTTTTTTVAPPVGQQDDTGDTPYGPAGGAGGEEDDSAEVLGREVSPSQDLSEFLVPSNSAAQPVSPTAATAWQRFVAAWFELPFWVQQLIGIPVVASLIFSVIFVGARVFGGLSGRHVRG